MWKWKRLRVILLFSNTCAAQNCWKSLSTSVPSSKCAGWTSGSCQTALESRTRIITLSITLRSYRFLPVGLFELCEARKDGTAAYRTPRERFYITQTLPRWTGEGWCIHGDHRVPAWKQPNSSSLKRNREAGGELWFGFTIFVLFRPKCYLLLQLLFLIWSKHRKMLWVNWPKHDSVE